MCPLPQISLQKSSAECQILSPSAACSGLVTPASAALDVTCLYFCFPQIPLSLMRGMLSSGEENHSQNYRCSGFQWTPTPVDPGEISIFLQDLYLSFFFNSVKSSFALSFLPVNQHMVGYLRLGFSPSCPCCCLTLNCVAACSFVQRAFKAFLLLPSC